MENLEKNVEKANEQIQRLKDWYEEHKNAFDYMNLKLHDVSYYCYSQMKEDFPLCYANDTIDEYSYFYQFCEQEYDSMIEDLEENSGIDFNEFHHQLGRTSSFYLHKQDVFQFERHVINWYWTMNCILSEIYGASCGSYTEFNSNGEIDWGKSVNACKDYMDDTGACEELNNEIEWITTEMFDDVVKHFEDMFKVYDYIKSFKENQVDAFKEWLQYYEDELAEQKRQEEEYEAERQQLISEFSSSIIRDIVNKHINSNDDILLLLKEIENKEIDYED